MTDDFITNLRKADEAELKAHRIGFTIQGCEEFLQDARTMLLDGNIVEAEKLLAYVAKKITRIINQD